MYERDGATSSYTQLGQSLFGAKVKDNFGNQVSLSSNGMIVAIGADDGLAAMSDDYVEVFAWDDVASNFKQLGQTLYGESHDDSFGTSLSLSGDGEALAVAAPHNDGNGEDSGEVKVFNNRLPTGRPTNKVRHDQAK